MGRIKCLTATLAATLFLGTPALAQERQAPSVLLRVPMWDAGGSFGLFWITTADAGDTWSGWENKAEYRFELGRYWTSHLKTDIGFSTTNPWVSYETERFPVPGLRGGGFASIERRLRLYIFSPAVTYQFFENAFMHPYVTGGVRVGILPEHRVREVTAYRVDGITYSVPPVDEHQTTTWARPFVAGGFKSYINNRTFVRTEGLMAVGHDGASQVTLRLGIGVDF